MHLFDMNASKVFWFTSYFYMSLHNTEYFSSLKYTDLFLELPHYIMVTIEKI